MAYICTKPANSCNTCPHYHYDDDYGAKSCFAAVDAEKTKTENSVDSK